MNSTGFILFLAWRNVLRYRKRTMQNFLILFCGAFSIMLVDAYMKGFAGDSMERVVSQVGHMDVHAAGYLDAEDAMPLELAISDIDGVIGAMRDSARTTVSPGIRTLLVPSVETGCMLSNGDISRAAAVLATEAFARTLPGEKPAINPSLADVGPAIIAGAFYDDRDDRGAIIDEKYARKLGLTVGDRLILLGNDAYGSFSMVETSIVAVAREASLPGEAGCVVDLASFAPAFGLEGKATAISLWFASPGGTEILGSAAEPKAVKAVMETLSRERGLEGRTFSAISASYAAMFEFLDVFLAGMMAIFALVACVGITNTVLLSVQNRIKDLGTLRAIALSARQAGFLIYAETFITGLAASLAALLVAGVTVNLMRVSGFGLSFELSDISASLPSMIRPVLLPLRLLIIAAMSAVFPLLAAVLPARAARGLTIRESFSG